MPWKETGPMTERSRFCALHAEGTFSMSDLCRRFGIARKTGYKWLARYAALGVAGLENQSRAPHTCPHRTPPAVAAALLAIRTQHPTWGPKKLCAYLDVHQPELALPARSTVGDQLRRAGVTVPQRRIVRTPPTQGTLRAPTAPNEVWAIDFKGEFRLRDGQVCYPLTITDVYSRFLLACLALPAPQAQRVAAVLPAVFTQYGLPAAFRSDNAAPFSSRALHGLSTLSVGWHKLGIQHQRIRPGKPQDNGQHERMHRTLKAEATLPREADLTTQQQRFDRFREEFNTVRPHEGLGQRTPQSVYTPATRRPPTEVAAAAYPAHFESRPVSVHGDFHFGGRAIFLSTALVGELIGLEESAVGLWSVYFYDWLVGRFNEETYTVQG
jgi:transposase InsO family protein